MLALSQAKEISGTKVQGYIPGGHCNIWGGEFRNRYADLTDTKEVLFQNTASASSPKDVCSPLA